MGKLLRSLMRSLSFCVVLPAVPATVSAQAHPRQLDTTAGRDPLSTTVVEVSIRQVRIAFPTDTSGRWGWPTGAQSGRYYEWAALVGGMDGPTWISLVLYPRDSTDLGYSSLQELVAAGHAKLCIVRQMTSPCNESPLVRSTVEGHRVVLTLTDSILIRELFGTRPDSVRVIRQTAQSEAGETEPVPVRYVVPYVPQPNPALLAEAQRRRRRYEASITTISRTIAGGEGWWDVDDLWVAVGDSLQLNVKETTCHYDHCTSFIRQLSDSGWSVKNSRIASLRTCGLSCAMVYGRRVGKTTISVRGLHGRSDTMPSSPPPPRKIERKIRVGRPVHRIRLAPRPDTAAVGQPQTFGAKAFNRAGKAVPDVPIEILVQTDSNSNDGMVATRPRPVEFRTPGRRRVIATFRGMADTLVVTVVAKNNAR